ncbi:aldo-keto reductase-like protein [Lophiotrema nucula]|uniref:Aldo-keto reductase-like protein n=1 Tax=Lophiotrema nucula TaxID=690887 RepID=A0A6A5ZDG4_9PLEO|nr:aldo-keto reductase-like protein [Lophiotrema nucula]
MASSAKASSRLLSGESEPAFIYGTAWKKGQTERLVKEAIVAGFRSIDTAAQPRHYQEALVGQGIRGAIKEGVVKREDLYVQTKYTSPAGQDINNMPYHPLDPLETQVHTSVASSLKNLRPIDESEKDSYLDCVLLHSPLPTIQQTIEAWKILEGYVPKKIKALGISNVTLPILQAVYEHSTVKPSVVQNRFYPATKYDVPLRAFCERNGITYQSFWTLSGNPKLLKSEPVAKLAQSTNTSNSVSLYALVTDLGIVVLNGTTSSEHMDDDLAGLRTIKEWASENDQAWGAIRAGFQQLIEL